MAEEMQILVSIETQQANENLRAIITSLIEMRDKTEEASAGIDGLEQSLNKLNGAAGTASTSVAGIGKAAGSSAESVTAAKATIVKDLDDIKTKTGDAQQASEDAKTSVGSWLGAYAGVGAAIQFIGQIKEAMQGALDIQNQLVAKKFTQDIVIKHIMSDLNLSGNAGEKIAQDLMQKIMDAAPVTQEQAAIALRVSNSAGFDPRTAGGMDYAGEAAKTIARHDLDEQSAIMLARAGEQQGVKDAEGMKRITAMGDAAYIDAPSVSRNAFMRGLISAWSAETAKGGDTEYLAAAYAAMIGKTRNERTAADSLRKIYDLAAGSNPKAEKYLAHQAAWMGVTDAGTATDADVDAEVGRGGKDSEGIVSDRERIAGLKQQSKIDREKFDAETPNFTRRHGQHRKTAAEVAAREDAFRHEQEKQAVELSKAEQKLRDDTQKLKDSLTGQEEIAAWRKVGLQSRVERVIVPMFGGAKTDEQRNQIVSGLGGGLNREDAAFSFSEGSTQATMRKALADVKNARAGDVDAANRAYEETSPAVNARTQGGIEIQNAEAVQPEEEYAKQFTDEYAAEAQRKTKGTSWFDRMLPGNGGGASTWGWLNPFAGTVNLAINDGFKEMVGARRLFDEMREFWDAMTPEEQKQNPELRDLIWSARQDLLGGGSLRPYWVQQSKNNEFALQFGKVRRAVLERRHKAGGPDARKLDKIKGAADITTRLDLEGSEFDLDGSEFDPASKARQEQNAQWAAPPPSPAAPPAPSPEDLRAAAVRKAIQDAENEPAVVAAKKEFDRSKGGDGGAWRGLRAEAIRRRVAFLHLPPAPKARANHGILSRANYYADPEVAAAWRTYNTSDGDDQQTAFDALLEVMKRKGLMYGDMDPDQGRANWEDLDHSPAVPLPPGAKRTGVIHDANTNHSTAPAASGVSYHSHTNVNIGSLYSNDGGDGIDLPGRLDGWA